MENNPSAAFQKRQFCAKFFAGKDLEQISKLPTEDIMEEAFPQINEDAPCR